MAIADRLKGPSLNHPFGTDEFGRDLMIRVLYGARVSLLVGGAVALLSCVLGTVTGIYASYFKILDHILMRICEGLIAIPGVLLAIALMAALGASNLNVIIALTIVYTPSVARIVRSSALVTRGLPYVEAAKVQGAGSGRILWKLILPSVISPLTVQASFIFAQAIISEASLSFLGAGIPAPAASWGNILQGSKQVLQKAPWTLSLIHISIYISMENATTTRNPSIMDKRNRTAVLTSGGRASPYGFGRSRAVKRMGMHLNTALEALLARLLTNHME